MRISIPAMAGAAGALGGFNQQAQQQIDYLRQLRQGLLDLGTQNPDTDPRVLAMRYRAATGYDGGSDALRELQQLQNIGALSKAANVPPTISSLTIPAAGSQTLGTAAQPQPQPSVPATGKAMGQAPSTPSVSVNPQPMPGSGATGPVAIRMTSPGAGSGATQNGFPVTSPLPLPLPGPAMQALGLQQPYSGSSTGPWWANTPVSMHDVYGPSENELIWGVRTGPAQERNNIAAMYDGGRLQALAAKYDGAQVDQYWKIANQFGFDPQKQKEFTQAWDLQNGTDFSSILFGGGGQQNVGPYIAGPAQATPSAAVSTSPTGMPAAGTGGVGTKPVPTVVVPNSPRITPIPLPPGHPKPVRLAPETLSPYALKKPIPGSPKGQPIYQIPPMPLGPLPTRYTSPKPIPAPKGTRSGGVVVPPGLVPVGANGAYVPSTGVYVRYDARTGGWTPYRPSIPIKR